METKMDSRFDHRKREKKIYEKWEKSGFFNPDNLPTKKNAEKFSMVLPPPNATGILHLGHAIVVTIEDIMTRFARMQGKRTLWLPGTDHAAIATEAVVVKLLAKEKKNKHDLGREKFLKRVDEFVEGSRSTIIDQMKALGASLDWSREAFTLDEKRSLAVRTAFKKMYDDELIYRGDRIVNWDPKGQTTISDDEVVYEERKGKFYYFKYGPFTIGTARPETKFGDKYVVIHPDDKRYKDYEHGQQIELEWINGPMTATVIKDEASDPEIGSGVMTITPWHSLVDFELAEKHDLDKEQIIDQYGKLLPVAQEFEGMKITEAREKIVEKLEKKGLVEKIDENYVHNIATSERTGAVVEPQIMRQWFVDVNKEFVLPHSNIKGIKSGEKVTLKKLMQTSVRSGQIEFVPERFSKTYFHWVDNLRDWCISRQIWYGHRVPAWYCTFCNDEKPEVKQGKDTGVYPTGRFILEAKTFIVSIEEPRECKKCGEQDFLQDPDTLDTWFSSALWTFSTLGWPEETDDLKTYHPTQMLETAYEILPFWVSRMILMTTYHLGEIPFEKVYLHGLVRNEQGQKISKSLGNNLDPLDVVEEYGADALRMSLVIGAAPGNDSKISVNKIKGYRNFTTKIWNASRFVLINYDESLKTKPKMTKSDDANLKELAKIKKGITENIEKYNFHQAGEDLYHYFWHTFADKIIEDSKERLAEGNDPADKAAAQEVLMTILKDSLKMLHPFMPYVTEEIWAELPGTNNLLMIEPW